MKNNLKIVFLLILMFPCAILFSSCANDNNKNANQNSSAYYTVQFDSDGGSEIAPITNIQSGSKIAEPTEPTKEHYIFDGWYLGKDKWNFAGFTVTENITLKAKWKTKVFVINEIDHKIVGLTEYGKTLSHIEIPSVINDIEINFIGDGAFYMCNNLKDITIPSTIKQIGFTSSIPKVFYGISPYNDVQLPSQVPAVDERYIYSEKNIFAGCLNLTNIYYDGTLSDWCKIIFIDYMANPMIYAKYFYLKNNNGEYEELTEIVIPNDIIEIKNYTFYGFNNLTKVTVSEFIIKINVGAFRYCDNLLFVVFRNPNEWKYDNSEVLSSDLSNLETAANLLKTYTYKIWTRT